MEKRAADFICNSQTKDACYDKQLPDVTANEANPQAA
jgi:hypothetical protein